MIVLASGASALTGVEDARGVRGVVGDVLADRHACRVGFLQGLCTCREELGLRRLSELEHQQIFAQSLPDWRAL